MLSLLFVSAILAFPQQQLKIGEYSKPLPGDVRSACPCMNTMANHGYFPRDGSSITKEQVKTVFKNVLNFGEDVSEFFFNSVISSGLNDTATTISLKSINTHGRTEHDASLVRNDFYFGDALKINQTLVQALIKKASNGKSLTFGELASFRNDRARDSISINPKFTFGTREQFIAFGEAALLYLVLQDSQGNIPVSSIASFLGEEKLPDGYVPPKETMRMFKVGLTTTQLRAKAVFSK
jgi:hypothetical protein